MPYEFSVFPALPALLALTALIPVIALSTLLFAYWIGDIVHTHGIPALRRLLPPLVAAAKDTASVLLFVATLPLIPFALLFVWAVTRDLDLQ